MSDQWDKAALELAGVGAIVMIYRDLHDTLDREHEPTVRRWLTWGGLLSPDGENLTARGEEARRAALRLLAERQVSPARIEALAPVPVPMRPSGDPHRLRAELDAAGLRAPEDRELAAVCAGYDIEDPVVHAAVNGALAGGDVARWAALADAATPGPWEAHERLRGDARTHGYLHHLEVGTDIPATDPRTVEIGTALGLDAAAVARLRVLAAVARGTVDVRGLRPEAVARVLRAIERERARAKGEEAGDG